MKKIVFFSRVWYRYSPFAPLGRVDEWTTKKALTILNTSSFVWIFSDYGCQNTEKSVSLTASDIETFLKTEENQNMERNIESFVFIGFGNGILAAENEIAQLICLKGNLKANIRNV